MPNPFKPKTVATCLLVTLALAGGVYFGIIRNLPHYPYGQSHCCDKALYIALHQYAEEHDGWFPRGEATCEASLSLLYRQEPGLAETLRGKTIQGEMVRERLERGDLLTPETCGWHYVEGLRSDDHPRLALFWDKEGLGHNGQRLPQGGHYVCFLSGIEYIRGAQWQAFLAEQAELHEAIQDRDHKRAEPREEGSP